MRQDYKLMGVCGLTMLLPVVGALGGRFAFDGPRSAAAAPGSVLQTAPIPAMAFASEINSPQRFVLRAAELPPADSPSPIPVVSRPALRIAPPPPVPVADEPEAELEPPSVRVSSIMRSGGGAVALIDDRVRRVGDELGDGWRLTVIDPAARVVTLTHESGGTHSVWLDR
mgnify:CR=1 FL=1